MPIIPARHGLGAPERGQTMLAFGGGAFRPVRPGPRPVGRAPIGVPAGAFTVGGVNELAAIRMFTAARLQPENLRVQQQEEDDDFDDASQPRKRRSYTREEKLTAINLAEGLWHPAAPGEDARLVSNYHAAQILKLSTSQLANWRKSKQRIINQKKQSRRSRDTRYFMGKEDDMENILFEEFKEARAKGRGCSKSWFMRRAKRIFRELHPERSVALESGGWEYLGFKFSDGWFQGMRRRYRISNRASTKQAQRAPDDMREKLQSWMQYNRRQTVILPDSHLGNSGDDAPQVGRYKLSEIGNVDQTPLAFEFLDTRTYDFKGNKTVWLKETRSGWDRRQATLQVCVFADGIRRCKPQLIYHGAEQGRRPRIKERAAYAHGVDVLFNEKAWASEQTMLHWVKNQYKYATAYPLHHKEPRLLVLDAFRAHLTDPIRKELSSLYTTGSFIPGGCTGYVQPLDIALNQPLKALIKAAADRHYDLHEAEWEAGKWSTVSERRILLTHFVVEAWNELHIRYKDTIVDAFRRVGLSLNPDSSEDSEIRVKGVDALEVGDYRRQDTATQQQDAQAANDVCRAGAEIAREEVVLGAEDVEPDTVQAESEAEGEEAETDRIPRRTRCKVLKRRHTYPSSLASDQKSYDC